MLSLVPRQPATDEPPPAPSKRSLRGLDWFVFCVADVQTGFRYYSRALIERLGLPSGRFEAESALVVRAVRSGLRVSTTPVRLGFADGMTTSHYRPIVDSVRIATAVIGARFGGHE